jgi:hypothetical protein
MRLESLPRMATVLGGLLAASCTTDMPAGPQMANENLQICHGYGCTFHSTLKLGASDAKRLASIMSAGAKSPRAERAAISNAVRYFEDRTRHVTGVTDQRKSEFGAARVRGQMDCVDESTNTHTLLKYLERHGLLRHHDVMRNASRGFLIDGRYPHSTAVIRDQAGVKWVVDSWYAPMGGAPDILPLSDWLPRGFLASGELTEAERKSGF